jgi:hypothetical protein
MKYTNLGTSGLDVSRVAFGAGVVPVASAIADRWRELVHNGSSGLDVSAARNGPGPVGPAHPDRWPEWIGADRPVADTRQPTSMSS